VSVRTHALTPQNAGFFTPKGAGAGRQISENLKITIIQTNYMHQFCPISIFP
jgi:hypothetical protein